MCAAFVDFCSKMPLDGRKRRANILRAYFIVRAASWMRQALGKNALRYIALSKLLFQKLKVLYYQVG